jgi:hypothetical protein
VGSIQIAVILNQFDQTISTLHAFERVRYPDRILPGGAVLRITWEESDEEPPRISYPPRIAKLPHFHLNMPQLDRLIREIFSRASIEPTLLINGLGLDAQRYLSVYNRHFTGPLVQNMEAD